MTGENARAKSTRGSVDDSARVAPASPHNHRMLAGWLRVKDKYKQPTKPQPRRSRLTPSQFFMLMRRLAIILSAIYFMGVEFAATSETVSVLQSIGVPLQSFGVYRSTSIGAFLGSGSIRDSPLVLDLLGNDTSPRSSGLYFWSETMAVFDQCEISKNAGIYSNASLFMRFARFVRSTSYNLTFLNDLELVVPMVDCTFEGITGGDISVSRVYNLLRSKSDPEELFIMSVALSVQEYTIPEQSRGGPAYVGTMSIVNDLRATDMKMYYFMALDYPFVAVPTYFVYEFKGYTSSGAWQLVSIPRDDMATPATTVYTGRRRGFYFNAETDQSNICTMYRKTDLSDPIRVLTAWEWEGQPAITDSWAWVHGIHFIFGMQTLFSTIVLFIIMFRNWQRGKIWIGDAFASLSNGMMVARMVLVIASWYVNEFWVLTEFALSNANTLSGTRIIPIRPEFVTADMLVVMLGCISLIGWLARERIDPAIAVMLYVVIHSFRLDVIRMSPSLVKYLANFAKTEYAAGIVSVSEVLAQITPLRLWTLHRIKNLDFKFLFASFFPKYLILWIAICYTVARRVYHHYHPDQAANYSGRSKTAKSSNSSESETIEKNHLTIFEIATGALLRSRFGLISDYKNYVFIKGMRYASADGIYCSGYVIANGKFLVATDDIFAIVLMKLVRSRLYNVYVYEVDGSSVQQTARLVYPDTLSWKDVTTLNTSILS